MRDESREMNCKVVNQGEKINFDNQIGELKQFYGQPSTHLVGSPPPPEQNSVKNVGKGLLFWWLPLL